MANPSWARTQSCNVRAAATCLHLLEEGGAGLQVTLNLSSCLLQPDLLIFVRQPNGFDLVAPS